jgi:hypothetical protein
MNIIKDKIINDLRDLILDFLSNTKEQNKILFDNVVKELNNQPLICKFRCLNELRTMLNKPLISYEKFKSIYIFVHN